MTPAAYLRDIAARQQSLRAYAAWFDDAATEQAVALAEARIMDCALAGERAHLLLRAFKAETDDPEPVDPPWCDCIRCSVWVP